jgi:hypothetical protein
MVFKRPLEKGEVSEDTRFAALNTQEFVSGEVVGVTPAEVAEVAPAEEVVAPVEATVEEVVPEVEAPAETPVEATVEEVATVVAE